MNWIQEKSEFVWLKLKTTATRFKAWAIGGLTAIAMALGLVAVATAAVTFTWTNPTLNVDGTALELSQIVETRLYCDLDPATFTPQTMDAPSSHPADLVVLGPATGGQLTLSFGRHDCFATTLASYDDGQGTIARMESGPSNVATKVVAPPQPNPPGLD